MTADDNEIDWARLRKGADDETARDATLSRMGARTCAPGALRQRNQVSGARWRAENVAFRRKYAIPAIRTPADSRVYGRKFQNVPLATADFSEIPVCGIQIFGSAQERAE